MSCTRRDSRVKWGRATPGSARQATAQPYLPEELCAVEAGVRVMQCSPTYLKNCSLLRAGVRVTSTSRSVEFAAFQKVWTAGRGHAAVLGAEQPAAA